jgi:hypothetical protein
MGGITYARATEGVEIPRPYWQQTVDDKSAEGLIRPKLDSQQ